MRCAVCTLSLIMLTACAASGQEESAHLYGIHDAAPNPQPFLDHLSAGNVQGWVTATVAVGHDPGVTSGADYRSISNQGHSVICRVNNGYCPDGTIPMPSQYDAFATRVANFVKNTKGCNLFVIGNETNLATEWPLNQSSAFVSPQMYADCFVKCYQKIKQVRPDANVVTQALAPWGGPYGAGNTCGHPHDANPISWVQYLNDMLTAITEAGVEPDGIALHINSRGYADSDIHSTAQISVGGQRLYWSFYVYKDWINYGIPQSLYHLPLYATECNGVYYWKGGFPECLDDTNPSCKYQPGWIQEIYAEINRWNTEQGPLGKPVFHCVNMYRWCSSCDGWNIDGSPQEHQILSDFDDAIAQRYRWDAGVPESHGYLGDFDGDVDVDQADFGVLQGCYTGTGTPVTDPACQAAKADLDRDRDVDMADYLLFQGCMSGSGISPATECWY